MKPGDHVQTTQHIVGSKKNVYALPLTLCTIVSVEFIPVLLVTEYGCKERFPVHVDNVTQDLHKKYVKHIQNDLKFKTVTRWL